MYPSFLFSQQEENSLFENKIFNIPIEDSSDADIYSYFQNVVEFIGKSRLIWWVSKY